MDAGAGAEWIAAGELTRPARGVYGGPGDETDLRAVFARLPDGSVLEYDGSSHIDAGRLQYDRSRHNWLADRGWRIHHFTARGLYRALSSVVATVRSLL